MCQRVSRVNSHANSTLFLPPAISFVSVHSTFTAPLCPSITRVWPPREPRGSGCLKAGGEEQVEHDPALFVGGEGGEVDALD